MYRHRLCIYMNGDKLNNRTAAQGPWHYSRGLIFAPGIWAQICAQKSEAEQSGFKLLEPLLGPKKRARKQAHF